MCPLAKLKKKGKARVWGLSFGGEVGNECVLRGMMWADNDCFFHDREILVHMVNDVIEELLDLDTKPLPESLWWTCSYEEEDKFTPKVAGRGREWDLFSWKSSMCWDIVSIVKGKVHKEWKRHCAKELEVGGATFIFTVQGVFH